MRYVVKLGTRLLTDESGELNKKNIQRIASEIGELIDSGHEFIIVSSGAIGAGCGRLGRRPSEMSTREKQAAASVGQTDLINAYRGFFEKQGRTVGQILVTSQELNARRSYLNIRNTINTLVEMGIIPVINENDTVAVEEIRYGDNDRIAGIVAAKVDADSLIILTNVDGLIGNGGKLVKEIDRVTPEIEELADSEISEFSSGGMKSKIETARMVSNVCGIDTYFASGLKYGNIKKICAGGNPGTVFSGRRKVISHKKRWIAGLNCSGKIEIDSGAVRALAERNSSLLTVGIKSVKGEFREGDAVKCTDSAGRTVAVGLSNYSSSDLKKIAGIRSSKIKGILGYGDYEEAIHKDNLVILSKTKKEC